jgi:hypothetical protein
MLAMSRPRKLQLAWVVENGKGELRELARLRLAALLLDEKAYDEALKQLDGHAECPFRGSFRGQPGRRFRRSGQDWPRRARPTSRYSPHSKGDSEARDGTRCRMRPSKAAYRESVQLKLDALGEPA